MATKGDEPPRRENLRLGMEEPPPFPRVRVRFSLTVHGEPVGFVDHHDLLILVHGPTPERFGQDVGVNALQPLAQLRQLPKPPLRRVQGGLWRERNGVNGSGVLRAAEVSPR